MKEEQGDPEQCSNLQADTRENLGDYKSAAIAYKRAIAEAPAADLGLLEVQPCC